MADSIQRASGKSALDLPPSTTKVPAKPRKKVALAPGHSMLDWARLKAESGDLRGVNGPQLLRVTLSELKKHNKRSDAWTAINGNVYNMTPFFGYHPGGDDELMRIAGRDGTRLFALTHGWVSADMMMGQETLVGFLVREQQS
ncbi:cytochrome b5-like heme/steroid binding domain-containing protein [Auriculariales sp. MPI-PUGE-AT-0066]|nr:cytochrome b5-like heme/steroid binding domain-containing protein [Auriculariales sp. MPI-PUGE-AT-0066]